jgi:hypothetical protein
LCVDEKKPGVRVELTFSFLCVWRFKSKTVFEKLGVTHFAHTTTNPPPVAHTSLKIKKKKCRGVVQKKWRQQELILGWKL